MAVCWVPVDTVGADNGPMGYVRGSHRWGRTFKPSDFVTETGTFPERDGIDLSGLDVLPPVDPDDPALVYLEAEPGDVIVHHWATVHGSAGNTSATATRRAASVRYALDGCTWYQRTVVARAVPLHGGPGRRGGAGAPSPVPRGLAPARHLTGGAPGRSIDDTDPMDIDLLSVGNYAGGQPHDQFAWLRANDPVHRHDEPNGPGFWAVTRYHDVKAVGRDHETFSSRPTIMIHDPDPVQDGVLGDHVMMLMADPPLHTRMRRLVSREFTPRAAQALRPRIAELATRIVDEVADRGACDLVSDLAGEMPSFVIADVLGIPLEDGRSLYNLTEALHSSAEVVGHEARAQAYTDMFTYSHGVYREKRARPADDLASLLANGALEGRPIDEIDFFLWFMLLVDAGGDTTRNLVGGGFHALFDDPGQLARLRADVDGLLPTAIEELLRWVSPVIYMRRTATPRHLAGRPADRRG